jgi:hypothetical protein
MGGPDKPGHDGIIFGYPAKRKLSLLTTKHTKNTKVQR